jgi:hypothetical protein
MMPRFVTIGYGDQAGYDQTDTAVLDAAHAHDAQLRDAGFSMGIAAAPVQVRNHGSLEVTVQQGPFMASTLPVAGFTIIEADSLADAIALVSRTPCAVAQGVVEVWPLDQ